MEEKIEERNSSGCPSIVFRVHEGFYSVNSEHVSSIMTMPHYEVLPDAPPNISGIFTYRGEAVPMLDLRVFFGIPSLQEEYRAFQEMLEARKQDHIHWVNELERSIQEGKAFTLAVDPHKCAFGKWYDNYHPENQVIAHHLKKLDEPHKRLHNAAIEVANCSQQCELCKREKCLKTVMQDVKGKYEPVVLGLLEEAKSLFESAYHEMLLVLDDGVRLGLVVDEVIAVEDLSDLGKQTELNQFHTVNYIRGVKKSSRISDLILELDETRLLALVGGAVSRS